MADYTYDYQRKVLSIDPGITTGYCVLEYKALGMFQSISVYEHDIIPFVDGGRLLSRLANIHTVYNPDRILIERIPDKVNKEVAKIRSLIDENLSHRLTYYISPGEWKPVAGKVKLPFSPSTQHEKDAYRMARYFFFKEFDVPLT